MRSYFSPTPSTLLRIGMAVALVVLIVLVGLMFLNGRDVEDGLVAVQTREPDPNAGLPAVPPLAGAGPLALEPGRYVILGPSEGWARSEGWPNAVSVTLPEGWTIDTRVRGSVLRGIHGTGASLTEEVRLDFWSVDNLLADTCSQQFGAPMVDPPVGPTVDDLVSAVTSWPAADTTAPADVTLDGFSGMQLELVVPADAPGCDEHQVWFSPPSHGTGAGLSTSTLAGVTSCRSSTSRAFGSWSMQR